MVWMSNLPQAYHDADAPPPMFEEPGESDPTLEIDPWDLRKMQRRQLKRLRLAFVLTAVVCFALGGLFMRWRYKRQQVIVSINGRVITKDEFVHRMEVASGTATLQHMIDEIVQDQYARKMSVNVTPQEFDARYKTISSLPDFPAYLGSTHQSVDDVQRALRTEMMLNKITARKVSVSEADVALYYQVMSDKHNAFARFYTPPRVTIAVIATADRARILQARQELDHGARFEDLAARYSEDAGSKARGGEAPPITFGRTPYHKVPQVEAQLFAMRVGEVIGPIQIGSRWNLVFCREQEPEIIQSRKDVDYECRVGAMMARLSPATASQIHADYLAFRRSAIVRSFQPEYMTFIGGN
jgi:parvulin-like peptidyl-prolyl isomerase